MLEKKKDSQIDFSVLHSSIRGETIGKPPHRIVQLDAGAGKERLGVNHVLKRASIAEGYARLSGYAAGDYRSTQIS